MKHVEDRLVRELGEIADQAATSHDALAVIQTRAASSLDEEQEVVVMLTPATHPHRRRRPRMAVALGAIAAVVLALFGAAVMRPGTDDIATVDSTISTEEAAAVETTISTEETAAVETTPSAVPPVESLQWSRGPEDSAAFRPRADDHMSSVTAWRDGFVAVGESGDQAAVWLSDDGFEWSLIPVEEPLAEDELPEGEFDISDMASVVAGGPGLVAVGTELPPDFGRATIWTSSDGRSWTKIAADELGSDEPGNETYWFSDVTVGGPGLVAVGAAYNRTDPEPCMLCGGAVWTSVDGIAWARAPVDPTPLGQLRSVTAGASGLVALGYSRVLTSPDGLSWSVHEDVPELSAIAATEFGFVGVGTEELGPNSCDAGAAGECRATVWTSGDGITWTRVPHDDVIFGGGADKQGMNDVIAIDSGVIAVGTSVWYSPDGITWSRTYQDALLAGEHRGDMTSVAVGESAAVVMGTDGESYYTTEPSEDPDRPPVRSWHSAATPIVWVARLPG